MKFYMVTDLQNICYVYYKGNGNLRLSKHHAIKIYRGMPSELR